jgi:hypothetical protein
MFAAPRTSVREELPSTVHLWTRYCESLCWRFASMGAGERSGDDSRSRPSGLWHRRKAQVPWRIAGAILFARLLTVAVPDEPLSHSEI